MKSKHMRAASDTLQDASESRIRIEPDTIRDASDGIRIGSLLLARGHVYQYATGKVEASDVYQYATGKVEASDVYKYDVKASMWRSKSQIQMCGLLFNIFMCIHILLYNNLS